MENLNDKFTIKRLYYFLNIESPYYWREEYLTEIRLLMAKNDYRNYNKRWLY